MSTITFTGFAEIALLWCSITFLFGLIILALSQWIIFCYREIRTYAKKGKHK